MRKLLGWTALVLGVPALTWWANGHQAEEIQNTVTKNTEAELANIADLQAITRDLNVSVQGRDVRVSGHVLANEAENAEDMIESQLAEAGGRRIVDANLTPHPSFWPDFTANYDVGSGLSLSGITTPDVDGAGVAALLGLDEFTGALTPEAYGSFGAAQDKLMKLASVLNDSADTAMITVVNDQVDVSAQVSDLVNKDALTSSLQDMLGADAMIKVTDLSADAGAVRNNIKTGEREVFSGGYWLPSAGIEVNTDNCQVATNDVLANYQIQFVTGSAELNSESREAINRVAGILIACLDTGELTLEIGGHTDNVGDPISNLKLSNARAKSVLDAIASRGVKIDGVISKGYGDTKPIASNDTPEGQEQNRRTEIVWSKK